MILDTCQKTVVTFNNIIYEQKDGVSMGASLGPILAKIIMRECEKVIVDNLVKEGTIKLYIRYVDHTLLLAKRQDIEKVLQARGGFRVQKKVVTNFCKIDTIYVKVIALIFVVIVVVIIIYC